MIGAKEDWFSMVEFKAGKKVKTDYVHKVCWNKFLNDFGDASSSLKKSNYLLDIMKNQMGKMGMMEEQEAVYNV